LFFCCFRNTARVLMATLLVAFSTSVLANEFNVLLFTKTQEWHHKSQHKAVEAIYSLGERHSFYVEWHEDANMFDQQTLQKFDAVIFLSTTGDVLNNQQQQALRKFIQSGKGFVGIHSASDTEKSWHWYQNLIGRTFIIHPPVQTALISVLDSGFPGMHAFKDKQLWTDEWYEFSEPKVEGLNYLLSVNENSYNPEAKWEAVSGNGMGGFHPIAWFHYFDGGRSFYTSLGHMAATYDLETFQWHLFGGIYWAATGKGVKKLSLPMEQQGDSDD